MNMSLEKLQAEERGLLARAALLRKSTEKETKKLSNAYKILQEATTYREVITADSLLRGHAARKRAWTTIDALKYEKKLVKKTSRELYFIDARRARIRYKMRMEKARIDKAESQIIRVREEYDKKELLK